LRTGYVEPRNNIAGHKNADRHAGANYGQVEIDIFQFFAVIKQNKKAEQNNRIKEKNT
jgi:hypothetical protein